MKDRGYELVYTHATDTLGHGYLKHIQQNETWRLWCAAEIRKWGFIHRRVVARLAVCRRQGWDITVRWSMGVLYVRRGENAPWCSGGGKRRAGRPEAFPELRQIRPGQRRLFDKVTIPGGYSLEANRLRAAAGRLNKSRKGPRLSCKWTRDGMIVFREKSQIATKGE